MKLKKVLLALALGILGALFIGFLIEAIYESPDYGDYCERYEAPKPSMVREELCDFTYNQAFRTKCIQEEGNIKEEYDENGCVIKESCDYCAKEFDEAREKYNLNLFYITAPIGLLLIILGLYLPISISAIAGGALLGGILTIVQVTTRVFGDLGRWPRVILLGLELVIVIWVGVKKVKEGVIVKKEKKK